MPLLVRFSSLQNRLLKIGGVQQDFRQAASATEVIQPEETHPAPRLYCLNGQLEAAVAGVPGHSSASEEVQLARNVESVHAPVIRYLLKNCLVHPQGLEFYGGGLRKWQSRWIPPVPFGEITEVSKAAYCMSQVSHQYFGHWLQDACATALLARPDEALVLDTRPDWPHTAEYTAAFSLKPHRSPNLFVRELAVYDDFSQGSSKRQRYETLRTRAAQCFNLNGATRKRVPVYLRRGQTGIARLIANEQAVAERLEREGFQVLDVDGISAAQLFKALSAASVVVSIDGSHLNHVHMAMPSGSNLLMLVPADRFTTTQFGYASAVGIRFGILVLERNVDGYRVDLDAMMRTLDLFPPVKEKPASATLRRAPEALAFDG